MKLIVTTAPHRTGLFVGVLAAAAALGASAGTAPANAADCPSNQTLLPDSSSNPPYQCAEMHSSDEKKLKPWATKSWTSSPGPGYFNKTTCTKKDNKNVSITTADAGSGLGSWTATATNWDTDKKHHFAAGVLWATGSVDKDGYSNGCANDDGDIKNSILNRSTLTLDGVPETATVGVPVTLTASISPSSATGNVLLLAGDDTPAGQGTLSGGKVSIVWVPTASGEQSLSAAYHFDSTTQAVGDREVSCPTTGHTCGWSAAQSDSSTVTVSGTTLASAASSTPLSGASPAPMGVAASTTSEGEAGLVTLTKTLRMPAVLELSCPAGTVPMHAEVLNNGPGDPIVRFTESGPVVDGGHALHGHRVSLQLSCRDQSAGVFRSADLSLGTLGADALKTLGPRAGVFGGPGDDRLLVTRRNGFAHGGLQDDYIKVKAPSGVGVGGPGNDRLKGNAPRRALLVGGLGTDTLIGGSRGRILIASVDGSDTDRVVCRSKSNLVLADAGDDVRGPCGVVRRTRG